MGDDAGEKMSGEATAPRGGDDGADEQWREGDDADKQRGEGDGAGQVRPGGRLSERWLAPAAWEELGSGD